MMTTPPNFMKLFYGRQRPTTQESEPPTSIWLRSITVT
jgi:hypothetical protein